MSREIKFRAWNDVAKVMYPSNIPGLLIHFDGELNGLDENGMLEGTDNTRQHHLMQYTGLKDKHGTEIFEGDILAINSTRYVVGYREYSGGWQLEIKNEYCAEMVQGNCELLEIIGNVYEHKHLLEGTA